MKTRIPDQAEKLRQLAANDPLLPTAGNTQAAAVLDEPAAFPLSPTNASSPETLLQEPVASADKVTRVIPPVTPDIRTAENIPGKTDPVGKSHLSTFDKKRKKHLKKRWKEKNYPPAPSEPSSIQADRTEPVQPLPGVVSPVRNICRFPLNQSTQVIAITGGKGGVGKSNIACNLAIAMAQLNKRVLVLDADLSLANVDVLLGMAPRHNLSHVIRGEMELKDIMVQGPGGVIVIPGGSGVEELTQLNPVEMSRLFRAFDGIQPVPDVFLIDTAAGIHTNVMQFLTAADQVIVVTTPEPTAYTDAYALIKTLLKHQDGKEIGLLVNMVQNAYEAAEVLRMMLQMCRQFLNLSFNNIGFVPRDPEVLKAVRLQKPFLLRTPNAPASKTIRNIAATILQIEFKDRQPRGLRRFFNRLLGATPTDPSISMSPSYSGRGSG